MYRVSPFFSFNLKYILSLQFVTQIYIIKLKLLFVIKTNLECIHYTLDDGKNYIVKKFFSIINYYPIHIRNERTTFKSSPTSRHHAIALSSLISPTKIFQVHPPPRKPHMLLYPCYATITKLNVPGMSLCCIMNLQLDRFQFEWQNIGCLSFFFST